MFASFRLGVMTVVALSIAFAASATSASAQSVNDLLSNWLANGEQQTMQGVNSQSAAPIEQWNQQNYGLHYWNQAEAARLQTSNSIREGELRLQYRNQYYEAVRYADYYRRVQQAYQASAYAELKENDYQAYNWYMARAITAASYAVHSENVAQQLQAYR